MVCAHGLIESAQGSQKLPAVLEPFGGELAGQLLHGVSHNFLDHLVGVFLIAQVSEDLGVPDLEGNAVALFQDGSPELGVGIIPEVFALVYKPGQSGLES